MKTCFWTLAVSFARTWEIFFLFSVFFFSSGTFNTRDYFSSCSCDRKLFIYDHIYKICIWTHHLFLNNSHYNGSVTDSRSSYRSSLGILTWISKSLKLSDLMFTVQYLSQYLRVFKTVILLMFGTITNYVQTMGEFLHFLLLDLQKLISLQVIWLIGQT